MSYPLFSEYQSPEFKYDAVRPVQCLSLGWELVQGQYFLFVGMFFIIVVAVSCIPLTGIIWGAWMCGVFAALFGRMRGQRASFNDLGKGFQFIGPSFVVTILSNLPSVPLLIGIKLLELRIDEMDKNSPNDEVVPPDDLIQMGVFLGVLVVLYFVTDVITRVIFPFAYQLVVDKKMSGWQATKLSARAAKANFGGVVGLALIEALLLTLGLLLCCFGLVLLMPLTKAAWAVAYTHVFNTDIQPAPVQQPPPPPTFYGNPPQYGSSFGSGAR